MQKVLVIGWSGAGQGTLARAPPGNTAPPPYYT